MIYLGALIFIVIPALAVAEVCRCLYLEHRRDRIPILLYHRILSREAALKGEVPDDEMIWVSYDTAFADQTRYLHEAGYTTLDMDDYVAIRTGRRLMPARPVIITFDDGYLSNYTMAYPALRKYGQKATIFVAPEPDGHTRNLVKGVDGFLNEEQMRELSDHGISIQSHTLTHCVLTELDEEAVRHELSESRRRLEASTHRPVNHIAIPRAGYSRRVKRMVREAGYETACCNNKGSANGLSDPLALPRIVIERDVSLEDFARSLEPRMAVMLRIVGNIKRIPERLGGPSFARRVRNVLYNSPLRPLFRTRTLRKVMAAVALCYLAGAIGFAWHLVAGG